MKSRRTDIALWILLISLVVACLGASIVMGSQGQSSNKPLPRAPQGAPVAVSDRAVYVDDDGWYMYIGTQWRGVPDVMITATDEQGNSHSGTTITLQSGPNAGASLPIWLELLAGRTYTISAVFSGSAQSAQATVGGYVLPSGVGGGGSITVRVRQSDGVVQGIFYSEPMLA